MKLPPLPGALRRPFELVGINYTRDERERLAYVTGDGSASLHAELSDFELREDCASSAATHIEEARGSFPPEDFMQALIDQCKTLEQGRVTKADVLELAESLEALQTQIAQSAEYGLDELRKASDALVL